MQWLHLAAAVVALGGVIFQRAVVLPAVRDCVPPEKRGDLQGALVARARPFVHAAIGFLLLSGLYNYARAFAADRPPVYFHLLHGKILLALLLFAVAFVLTLPPGAAPRLQARRPALLVVASALGLGVLALSAYLRRAF